MRKHIPVLLLAMSLALTACSGDEKPSASDSPSPDRAEIAYYDCLREQGLPITHTDSGAPRVDKSKPHTDEKVAAAQAACERLSPPRPSAGKASPEQLAAAREEARCLRAEGISWYPDPDPVTGTYDDRAVTPEQVVELRTTHSAAVLKCRRDRESAGNGSHGG
ncbi:hypothetical protein [Streptomyces sp. NPDC001594]|uniref:hypothetical protein n=1 Tax=Streptomyces sp. NPDC001594 TaxID=3364590 RepID=UPI0036C4A8F4